MSTWRYGPYEGHASDLSRDSDRAWTPRGVLVGIGVECGLNERSAQQMSISLVEFARMSDGTQVAIREDRGVTIGWARGVTPSEADVRDAALGALLPDEDDARDQGQEHPWHELSDLLGQLGVACGPEDLKRLPYEVQLARGLRQSLGT